MNRPDGSARGWRDRRGRYLLNKLIWSVVVRCVVRLRIEGRENLPREPYVLCISHPSWLDPFVYIAALPRSPRVFVFGPKETDMTVGARNRLIHWLGIGVPYRPEKDNLIDTTRRAQRALGLGMLIVAAEGRVHAGETALLPFTDGAAYFALRANVPVVPSAVNGTSWFRFGRTVRVRFGVPIRPEGRVSRPAVDALTARLWDEVYALIQGYPEPDPPRGRFGRWVSEVFNEWPEGTRPPIVPATPGGPKTVSRPRPSDTGGGATDPSIDRTDVL